MTIGLAGALLAAVAYGAATVLQAWGVRRIAVLPRGVPLIQRARVGWAYGVGLLLDGAGFACSVVALRTLPLFLVESVVASSVAVTALLSVLFLGIRLTVREFAALVGVGVGLSLLAMAAAEGPAVATAWADQWWALGAAVATAGMLAGGIRVRNRRRAAVALSAAAGLGFGLVGVAARMLVVPAAWWQSAEEPALWALVVAGGVAIVGYGYALERGRVTVVAAITFALETVVPAVIGLVWLGDAVRAGFWPVAIAGFVMTLGACFTLAGRAEPPA